MSKLNNSYANASIICGALVWVPLLNFLLAPLSIVFGVIALIKAHKKPKEYGGNIRAIIGMSAGVLVVMATIYALLVFGPGIFVRT